jgi:Flp pilus assembly protein TadG
MNALRKLSDDSGQTLVITAFCMIVILGFIGLAIDVGHFRYVRSNLQTAADAAAIAGAIEVRVCGGTQNCEAMQTAAQQAMAENGYTATITSTCPTSTTTGLVLMVNNPVSSCVVSNDPNATKLNYVEAIVSDRVPTYFARLFGIKTVQVMTRSEAARGLGGPCIYALDPQASGSINVLVGLGVHSNCGIVDESDSSTAVTCTLGIAISAPKIDVHGHTASGLLDGALCGSDPPAHTGVPLPNPTDPLAYLPSPTPGTVCGSSISSPYTGSSAPINIILGGTYVFNSGVYCGAITVVAGIASNLTFYPGTYIGGINIAAGVLTNITFKPGTYILEQGSGLLGAPSGGLNITISALSSITGQGVTFYNAGNISNPGSSIGSISITAPATLGLSNFILSAPTSGEYTGILFFQGRSVTSTGTVTASLLQGSRLDGALYLPDAQLSYAVGAVSNNYNILVAKTINFGAAEILTNIGDNYATLSSGSPLNGDDVTLVQ